MPTLKNSLIPINVLAAVLLLYLLLTSLNLVEDAYIYQGKMKAAQDSTASVPPVSVLMKRDSASKSAPEPVIGPETGQKTENGQAIQLALSKKKAKLPKTTISFYDIILLMLTAGGLGGVLCNLRGFFEHFRERKKFPEELVIPYYIRLFSSPICGFFAYFIASLLVVTITVEQVAYDISFQGMVSFVSLGILAGYGAQEFMERMKEIARAIFGQKQAQYEQNQVEEWYKLLKLGIISPEEFAQKKQDILNNTTSEVTPVEHAVTTVPVPKTTPESPGS